MDVNMLLKTVNNLNDYISVTQVVINKYSNSKIQFNMSTVLSLKKIRSLEIEYFNKCDESGAGIKILELMLRLPPSKTWSLLGKELILLMQYWLEAIRKHLILHNNHWWNFLSTVLKFIQDIRSKHTVLSNILVQDLSECLLDLATKSQASVVQRFKLLQCYNSVCAESSRETRCALRNKLGIYFVKLSSILASCGDMRAQYSIMETLLRWLVPRQDVAVKHEAAAKWFPQHLYNVTARTIFIERPWQNFFKDAREFLNAHNMSSDLIATVICRRFCIGNVTLISNTNKDYYVDLNTSTELISLPVEPGLSDLLGTPGSDAVIISKENTTAVRMQRESSRVLISINIIDPRLLYPSKVLEHKDILIVVSCRSDLAKLNRALRRIFDTKYELLMDLESPPVASAPATSPPATSPPATSPPATSPPMTNPPGRQTPANCNMSEDTRFSNPVELSKRKRSGYMVRPKPPVPWKSPSTASTSSLALLREKLTAFPGYKFDKEPVSVCALPQLSSVSELSEDERHSLNATLGTLSTLSTHKRRTYGVCNKNYKRADRTSQSDEGGNKCITPVNVDENSISCLLVATIGSNDSLINDTLERLPRGKEVHTDNIVELLAKEALQSTDTKLYSTNEKNYSEINSDVIEETQHATAFINQKTFLSNCTKDVSSTDKAEDVQFVNDRRGSETITLPLEEKSKIHINESEQTSYSVQTVEDFFSHHCSQNRNDGLLISPSLAKKINETSSESTLDFDVRTPMSFTVNNIETNQCDVHFNYHYSEIVECLNDVVDIVCDNFENCTEYLSKEIEHLCDKGEEFRSKTPLKEIYGMAKTTKLQQKKKTPLKLQYKNTKTVKRRGKKPNKLGSKNINRMPTIVEKVSDVEKTLLQNNIPESNTRRLNDYETPSIKRKRKLYSPKDYNAGNEKTGIHISETEDDYSVLTGTRLIDETPKTLATSYKDIEKIRRTSARDLRIRKSGINLSPRTKKNNDIFDNLKITVEDEGKIILADKKISSRNKKLAVYNFSSDSEDDDFQKRKGVKRCTSTVGSVESAKSTRARKSKRRNVISNETNKEKKNKHDKHRKSKSDLKQQISDPRNEMLDERIREAATEALNTSIEIVQHHDLISKALEPIIHEIPEMEVIEDKKDLPTRRTTRRKRPTNLSLKKENVIDIDKNVSYDKELSVRSSPLPGLIIETVQVQIHKDPDDSITVAMLEKYKDIYNIEPLPDISEINTTHNLLSDLEQITYDSNLNITEEFNTTNRSNPVSKRLRNEILNISPKAKKSKLSTSSVSEEIESQVITLSEVSDAKSDKSIDTLGKSPITGHGAFDESPPNTEQLNQRFETRGLETQDLNESMKDYFNKLTNDIYEGSQSSHSEKKLDKTVNSKELEKSPIKLIKEMSTTNISPTISITRLSPKEIGRWFPPRINSLFGSNQSSENDHPVRTTRSQSKLRRNYPNSITTKSSKINFRKSSISPVKMFGEVNIKKSVTSDHNDYVEPIKNMTTKRKNLKTVNTNFNSSRYDLRKYSNKLEKSGKTASSKNSTNAEYSNKTRRSSPDLEVVKKENTRAMISDFESGNGSSINEWFDRNELQKQSRAESTDLSLKDNLENVMEKLETTLNEIHHKTSKKFVSMFVEAQKHLTDLKEKRRELYRQTALELISDIVKVTDDKFGELERRSQELDGRFVSALRDRARDVTRADRSHKRAMVALLKEDVQTVLNHIKNGRRENV